MEVAKLPAKLVDMEPAGSRLVRFESEPDLLKIGHIPLPPYIHEELQDSERYQTVYSSNEGSVAAPTAGLHFSDSLFDRLDEMGVRRTFVTLHVGWDSFRPVTSEDPLEHEMHAEQWELSSEAAREINSARAEGRRIISVGTTAVRLLENAALVNRESDRLVSPGAGWVDLFISPGFEFKVIDGLVTNFHLPKSTLADARICPRQQGYHSERLQRLLSKKDIRFYSFGDAMLIH